MLDDYVQPDKHGMELAEYFNAEDRKMLLGSLESNWEQYVSFGTVNKMMRHEIMRSWLRCADGSVDPQKGYSNKIMPYDQLRERCRDAAELINVAVPFMQSLYNSVRGSGYILMLMDKDGVILDLFGDTGMCRRAESLDTVRGATCEESFIGTTAPGICLKDKIPVRVFYKEHFCSPLHHWACSAAPIFGPDGRLLGALDMSSAYEDYHPYTLGMVIATVRAIERELCYRALHFKLKKTYHYIDAMINAIPEGMLIYNEKGGVEHINNAGAALFGVTAAECRGLALNRLIKNPETLTGMLANKGHGGEKRLSLALEKGITELNARFIQIKDMDEGTAAYVVTFNEAGKAKKPGNKNAGFAAVYTFDDIVYVSSKMREIITFAQKISMGDATVLIEGESGTGKELLAQAMHNQSSRRSKPFMVVNCAALPKDLIQSELFGYEEGTFTGARKGGKAGKFELANGGTIFLDEIGDMPLEVQANMLRVLQDKKFMRIGGDRNIDLDIRIIAATNKHLAGEVEKGTFRLDLFYRLNIVPVKIPPLRERPEDILPLARHFLEKQCLSMGREPVSLSSEAEQVLHSFSWPGNIRELENAIVCAMNTGEGDTISLSHLPRKLQALKPATPIPGNTLESLVEDLERKTINDSLNHHNHNISKAAQELGITRATLYKKIKKYNLCPEDAHSSQMLLETP